MIIKQSCVITLPLYDDFDPAAGASDLPQIAADLGDASQYFDVTETPEQLMIAALRAAHALIDGTDEDSIRVRAQIERALVAAGEVVVG
jgi:hypothetical protein